MTRSRQTADWGSRAGLAKIVPSSVAVGSGTGSSDTLGTVTFSGASSISLNSCLSSTYSNYRIILNITSFSANNYPMLRLRSGTTDNSSTNYNAAFIERASTNATVSGYAGSSSTGFQLGYTVNNGNFNVLDLFSPFETDYTGYFNLSTSKNATVSSPNYVEYKAGTMSVTTSYDGLSIVAGSGTLTGTLSIYGYTK
jgi:hypothetical protein